MDVRDLFFRARGWTPVPFVAVALYWAELRPGYLALGAVLAILGEVLRIDSIRYAGGATRTREVGAAKLVTGGPYSFTRNPLYLGNMMIYTGFSLASGAWYPYLPLAAFVYFTIQYSMIVSLEESTLTELFGAEYDEYKRKVPRILPTLSPLKGGTQPKHPTGTAMKEETRTLQGFIVVWILLAVRLVAL